MLRSSPLHPLLDAANGSGNRARFRAFGPLRGRCVCRMGGVPMTANDNPQLQPATRSGSQKRVRIRKIPVACDDEEFLRIEERAREVGLSRPSFLRACGLGTPGPRARRSPPVNAEALGRATAALNKVGSNLNQIAHVLNARGTSLTTQECFAALAETRAAAAAIRELLGHKDRP